MPRSRTSLARLPDRPGRGVRLGGVREVDRRLREVELRLGQAHVLECLRRSDCDEEGPRIGIADVLGGENHHSSGDEPRVLAAFEHCGQVVDGGVGITPAHRLDEGRDDVVVLIAGPVVAERALAGRVCDVACLER